MTDTAQHALTMPLTELRERVELAERLALAARLTPSGAYAAATTDVNTNAAQPAPQSAPAPAATGRKRRTKEEIAADEAKAAAATSPEQAAANGAMTEDDMMAAMETDPAPADNAGTLSLDDIGDADDMMAGFVVEEADKTPEEYGKLAAAIVKDIQDTKDTQRLAVAREALVKLGVQRATDVPLERMKEFYDLLPKK